MIRVSKVIVEHHTHLILHIGISSIHEEELRYIPFFIVTSKKIEHLDHPMMNESNCEHTLA
jgi:hypothetical protein